MDKVGKILMGVMAKKGLAGAAVSSQICFYSDEYGKGHFTTISYSKGVLKLLASDSIDAGEIQMMSEEILSYVNKKIGRTVAKKIRIMTDQGE
jgi:hypothetical protein